MVGGYFASLYNFRNSFVKVLNDPTYDVYMVEISHSLSFIFLFLWFRYTKNFVHLE